MLSKKIFKSKQLRLCLFIYLFFIPVSSMADFLESEAEESEDEIISRKRKTLDDDEDDEEEEDGN